MPYLVVVVTYALPHIEATVPSTAPAGQRHSSWHDLVTDEHVPLFNTLRDWRLERSKQEGVPLYVLCTNKVLGAIVKARHQALVQLARIEHWGFFVRSSTLSTAYSTMSCCLTSALFKDGR